MKYQNLSVIFVLIMLPISIVLSYYIQSQTDTLVLETTYQTKLNDSTYDAIAAYQMNSLNTQQISGESVKSYVLASVNTFFTTLATNFGMSSASKSNLLQYVPAILFTTYDGYYIYSPTYMPKVATNPNTGVGLKRENNNLIYLKKGQKVDISDIDVQDSKPGEGSIIKDIKWDENKYTTNPDDSMVQYETEYMLKPFIYYSAQYQKGNDYDFIASYSLDNYVTFYGRKKSGRTDSGSFVTEEFTKSGYLIDPTKIELDGNIFIKLLAKSGNIADPNSVSMADILKTGAGTTDIERTAQSNGTPFNPQENSTHNNIRYLAVDISNRDASNSIKIPTDAYNFINYYDYKEEQLYSDNGYSYNRNNNYENKKYYPNKAATGKKGLRTQTGDQIISDTLEIYRLIENDSEFYKNNLLYDTREYKDLSVKYDGIEIDDEDAKEYYIKAYFFSQWVQNNLSDVKEQDTVELKDDNKNAEYYTNFDGSENQIFNIQGIPNNNPESETSIFVQHKNDIIKNSIQYNLNLSISTYNNNHGIGSEDINNGLGFQLPVMKSEDWDSILNNVCMVSFMQGLPCGLGTFNNYAIVKSNNNNTSASVENMYFTQQIGRESKSTMPYHKFDCIYLAGDPPPSPESDNVVRNYEADQSAEFKYDAKRINTKIKSVSETEIVCFLDSATNKYYNYVNIVDPDPAKPSSNIDDLAVGDEIPSEEILSYTNSNISSNSIDLSKLPTGTGVKYLYDHQNESCYQCIVSGDYTPVIKIYNGKLYRSYVTSDNTLIINIGTELAPNWILDTGEKYVNILTNTNTPNGGGYLISEREFENRKKSIYTYLAKIRNNLYKTNDYVNR